MLRGTLPGRKPGTFAVRTSFLYAASVAALNSSGEMLISSSTWVGSSCFRVVADTRRRPPDGTTASIAPAVVARDCDYRRLRRKMERKTRFELATLALARRCSTAELLPRIRPERIRRALGQPWKYTVPPAKPSSAAQAGTAVVVLGTQRLEL